MLKSHYLWKTILQFLCNLGPVEVLLLPLVLVEGGPLHHRQVAVGDDQRYRAKHHLRRRMMILVMKLSRMVMMLLMIRIISLREGFQ